MSDTTDKISHTYVETEKKLEDAASTAWTFTLLGTLGIIALILAWMGLLPLHMPFLALLLGTLIMGSLFLIFIFVGVRAFRSRKILIADKATESANIFRIRQWFQEYYSADAISNGVYEEDLSIEQLYFLRCENISRLLKEQFPELEESFAEYMMELIYQMYFPD